MSHSAVNRGGCHLIAKREQIEQQARLNPVDRGLKREYKFSEFRFSLGLKGASPITVWHDLLPQNKRLRASVKNSLDDRKLRLLK